MDLVSQGVNQIYYSVRNIPFENYSTVTD